MDTKPIETKLPLINTILLLILVVVTLAYSVIYFVTNLQETKSYKESSEIAQTYVDTIHTTSLDQQDLMKEYIKEAYENPSIERISEQQLLATEYQMRMIQNLSVQIDLLGKVLIGISR